MKGTTDLPCLLLSPLFLDFLEFAEQFGCLVLIFIFIFILIVLLIAWDSC
jgi:hypothetical protein